MQVLNSSAIASGYAGRDPQGGFAMEAFTVLLKSLSKLSEGSSLFLISENEKKNYVKIREKMRDEEGGKIRKQ